MKPWGEHVYRIGNVENLDVKNPDESMSIEGQKKDIEPWLAAVFQSEHLALLLGSGFTKAVAYQAGTIAADMACDYGGFPLDDKLKDAAQQAAVAMGRGEANIEDQIRAANALAQGLKIQGDDRHTEVISALDALFKKFLNGISKTERGLKSAVEKCAAPELADAEPEAGEEASEKLDPLVMLVSFLLSFSSRTATRERLHIFTTNYDRLIEYGADLAGFAFARPIRRLP